MLAIVALCFGPLEFWKISLSSSGCGIWQFTCGSGDCIAGYDVCDGIPQCDDNSDEAPETCPSNFSSPIQVQRQKSCLWYSEQTHFYNHFSATTAKTTAKGATKKQKPSTTTAKPPIQVNRPDDLNKWGREGEKSNDLTSKSSNFQHRGSTGVQVPMSMPYPNNNDPR